MLVGLFYLQTSVSSQIVIAGPDEDSRTSSNTTTTLSTPNTPLSSTTATPNTAGDQKVPILTMNPLVPSNTKSSDNALNSFNPTTTYARPDINMFVDLTVVSEKCDTLHTSVQPCMDYLRDHEDEYLVRHKADLPTCDSTNIIYYHAYWRGLMGPGLIWILKSFMYTQRLECSRYVIWTEGFVPLDFAQIEQLMEKEKKVDEAMALLNLTAPAPKNPKYPKIKMPMHYEAVKELKKLAPYVEVRPFHLREELMRTSGLSQEQWDHWVDSQLLAEAKKSATPNSASTEVKEKYAKMLSQYRWPAGSIPPQPRFKWPNRMIANVSVELKGNAVSDSDTVRFILLYNYGGMYVDTDVLFLRDMRPWFYTPKAWSSSWGIHDHYNTALLKATKPQDPVMARILDRGVARGSKFHPHEILGYLKAARSKNTMLNFLSAESLLTIIPSGVFDAVWPWMDGRHEKPILPNVHITSGLFYGESKRSFEFRALMLSLGEQYVNKAPIRKLRTMENLFNGAPAYHCHGIGFVIEKDSWVDILLDHYNCFLAGDCHNIYNERFQVNSS